MLGISIVFCRLRSQHADRSEIDVVGGDEPVIHAVVEPLDGEFVPEAVDMPLKAAALTVGREHVEHLAAYIIPEYRRIMQKA